jgi:hypothetical protein
MRYLAVIFAGFLFLVGAGVAITASIRHDKDLYVYAGTLATAAGVAYQGSSKSDGPPAA